MNVAGHSPNELWMRFDDDDRSWQAWGQAHVGDVIEKINGRWVNQGRGPLWWHRQDAVPRVAG